MLKLHNEQITFHEGQGKPVSELFENIQLFPFQKKSNFLCVHAQSLSHVQLSATPWITAHQAPLSMGFSRQEYWNGLPFPPPGDLPDPEIELISPALEGAVFAIEPPGAPFFFFFEE